MEEVKDFLQRTPHLECLEEKTKIIHHSKGVIFLGYHLQSRIMKADANRVKSHLREGRKIMRRDWTGRNICLLVPESKVREFVKRKRYGNLTNRKNWELCIEQNF
ncbi:MAG: hypothetical protein P8O70_03755 [SAR324 cluster bacterium]|nr:hypothetical protein [SAR324 cluster bacterium]